MRNKIMKVICEYINIDVWKVKPEFRLEEDLDLDELDRTELAMKLEDEFGIEILDEEAEPNRTVEELVQLVQKKI